MVQARPSADRVAFDVLQGSREEPLQGLARRMQREDHHRFVAVVAEEPALRRTALQMRERPDLRPVELGVVHFFAKVHAAKHVLEFLAAEAAALGNIREHFAFLVVVVEPGEQRPHPKSKVGGDQVTFRVDGLDALRFGPHGSWSEEVPIRARPHGRSFVTSGASARLRAGRPAGQ